ncbi:colicin immunity protein [Achromobacter spanius]|uniref:colicin immunity protein n=1 Tax=Achromobacter spanius TaxID=217203 RepID=UPI003208DA37
MKGDRRGIYDSMEEFFNLDGSILMKLTPGAAISVCAAAETCGLFVLRIEGGMWRHPGFEARVDCIWDGVPNCMNTNQAKLNNQTAAAFIRSRSDVRDVFLITVGGITF